MPENRECLFYSSSIPTTSKNDNFYIVCLRPYPCMHERRCVCAARACVCEREWGPTDRRARWARRMYWCCVCLCYRCRYVSLYCCSMFQIQNINARARLRQIRQHYRYIFVLFVVFYWKFSSIYYWAAAAAAVAGLNCMATPPIFSRCLSALSFSVCNIVVAILFFFSVTLASHDLEFTYVSK